MDSLAEKGVEDVNRFDTDSRPKNRIGRRIGRLQDQFVRQDLVRTEIHTTKEQSGVIVVNSWGVWGRFAVLGYAARHAALGPKTASARLDPNGKLATHEFLTGHRA